MKNRVSLIVFCAALPGLVLAFWIGRLSSGGGSGSAAGRAFAGGLVGFEEDVLDFGERPWNTAAPFEAVFRNSSKEPVVVETVGTSCGCTGVDAAAYAGRRLAPGEKLVISGRLETGLKPGRQTQQVDVLLDSGVVHTARLRATVVAGYEVSAAQVDFGELDLCEEAPPEPRVVLFRSEQAEVVALRSGAPWAEAGTYERPDGTLEIVLNPRVEDLAFGLNHGTLEVETSDPQNPVARIALRATGKAAVRPFPSRVMLSADRAELVRFATVDGARTRVVEARAGAGLECELLEDGYVVRIAGVQPTPAGGVVWVRDEEGRRAKVVVAGMGE